MNGTIAKTFRAFAALTGRDPGKMKKVWKSMSSAARGDMRKKLESEILVLRREKRKLAPTQYPVTLLSFGQ